MENEQIKKQQIKNVMWNLQNLARQRCLPTTVAGEAKVRYMLRAALSVADDILLTDTLIAWKEFLALMDDDQIRQLIDADTVRRLLALT